jgi:hypothetical protein
VAYGVRCYGGHYKSVVLAVLPFQWLSQMYDYANASNENVVMTL